MSKADTKEHKIINIESPGFIFDTFTTIENQQVCTKAILEQIIDRGHNKYVYKVFHKHSLRDYDVLETYRKDNDTQFVPVSDQVFPPLGLPDFGPNDDGLDYLEIYNEVLEFCRKHIYFIDESAYYVLASYCIGTWIFEIFDAFPYALPLGDFSTGKTRVLEVMLVLCHKALMTPNASEAVIYTIGQMWRPTLLYDESEGLNDENKQTIIGLANAGYKADSFAYRVQMLEGGNRKIDRYNVYFPKVFAGTKELARTLESRCIPFKMVSKPKNSQINEMIDRDWAFKIRRKLLGYRLENSDNRISKLADIGVSNARIKEIFTPIAFVTPSNYIDHVKKYARKVNNIFNSVRGESPNAIIIEAVVMCYPTQHLNENSLSLSELKSALSVDIDELNLRDKKLTDQTLIKILKEMGCPMDNMRRDTRKKSRFIKWDQNFEKWLLAMIDQYISDENIRRVLFNTLKLEDTNTKINLIGLLSKLFEDKQPKTAETIITYLASNGFSAELAEKQFSKLCEKGDIILVSDNLFNLSQIIDFK